MGKDTLALPAVVTAGGRIKGDFAATAGTDLKALAPLGGKPVIAHVIEALRVSGRVSHIAVVGPAERLRSAGITADEFIEEGDSGPENFRRGLSAVQGKSEGQSEGRALLCATDMAFLDAAAVHWLVEHAPRDADIVYPIITDRTYLEAFPGSPNTFAPLTDGNFTGSSIQVVRPRVILDNMPLIEAVFDARKSLLAMAKLLGPRYILKFALRRLTLAEAEARAAQIIGCRCAAFWIKSDAPGYVGPRLCADMDGLADYEYTRRRWSEMVGTSGESEPNAATATTTAATSL